MHIPKVDKTYEASAELANSALSFGINQSAQAFRVLSANLYSDRIQAVLREYGTNAADAHKDNGNAEQPFDVHLPTNLNPHLIIRDYGTGISPEKIAGVYIRYFASDKTNSNDFNGMLGLGCKSAFAYTDNFLVTSFYNGKKFMYSAFIGEDDYPKMVAMGEEDTTDRNGVEIKIAVRREDFRNFYEKAEAVYRRFRVRPNLTGHKISIDDIRHTEAGQGWKLRENDYDIENGAWAVMANVAYPIRLDDATLTDKHRAILASNIDIEFGNGELNIAPSREALTFDKRTIANVQKRLNEITAELAVRIEGEFASAKNMWEARMKLYNFRQGNFSALKEVFKALEPLWNGQKVTLSQIQYKNDDVTGFRFTSRSMSTVSRIDLPSDFAPVPDAEFIENDLKKGAWTRCNLRILEHKKPVVYLLNFKDDAAREDFLKGLGMEGVTLPKVSTFPSNPSKATGNYAATAQGKARILRLVSPSSRPSNRDHWTVDDVDLDKGGIYFQINRYEPYLYNMHQSQWFKDLNELNFDYSAMKVYGVKNSMIEKVKNRSNWITLEEFAKNKIKELLESMDYAKTLARLQDYKKLDRNQRTFFTTYKEAFNDGLKMVAEAVEEEFSFYNANLNALSYPMIATRYGLTALSPAEGDITLNLIMAEALEQYPMLKILVMHAQNVGAAIVEAQKDIILNYLHDVDEKMKKNSK